MDSLLPSVPLLSFVEAPRPSGQNQLATSTPQAVIFGFGLRAKLAYPSAGDVIVSDLALD